MTREREEEVRSGATERGAHWSAGKAGQRSGDIPFYGGQPAVDEVEKINAPLLLQFGELDERVNAGWPAYEEALKAAGKEYMAHFCPGANHGFHNDTIPRYDEEAAKLAWSGTVEFLAEHLK